MNNTFKPAWWLPGPHLQTLWQTLFRQPIKNLKLTRERFELSDGDFLDLDWVEQDKIKKGPIVLVLHGLEGSIESPYATGILDTLHQSGFRAVFMHFRACSDELNRMPRTYHSGDTGDVDTLIQTLHEREPHTKLAVVGFSLGGNVLVKWLGETGSVNLLSAAVAISVPFQINKAADHLEKGFARFYQWYLLHALRTKTRAKFQWHAAPFDIDHLAQLKTIREFDDYVTAPLHGFINAEEYYRVCSCRQYIKTIHVPTLLIQAKDDPFMTPDVIPTPEELSSSVTLEVTESGGHVGFVMGDFPWQAEYWLEQRIPVFLREWL